MCMILESTDWPYEENQRVFYKLFYYSYVTGNHTSSPCYCYEWNEGLNDSLVTDEEIKDYIKEGCVSRGFHTFVKKEDAEYLRDNDVFTNVIVVEVIGKKEDFIGIGGWSDNESLTEACFKKLTITSEEWKKLCV